MHKKIFLLLLILQVTSSNSSAGWEDYQESSLKSVLEQKGGMNRGVDFLFTPGLPYKITVTYTGKFREISSLRKSYLEKWLKSLGLDPHQADLFTNDVLVVEGKREFWLPVQNVLISAMKKEVQPMNPVTLYVVWTGAVKDDWIFIVNEFNLGK